MHMHRQRHVHASVHTHAGEEAAAQDATRVAEFVSRVLLLDIRSGGNGRAWAVLKKVTAMFHGVGARFRRHWSPPPSRNVLAPPI